jgi:hypothetical protein
MSAYNINDNINNNYSKKDEPVSYSVEAGVYMYKYDIPENSRINVIKDNIISVNQNNINLLSKAAQNFIHNMRNEYDNDICLHIVESLWVNDNNPIESILDIIILSPDNVVKHSIVGIYKWVKEHMGSSVVPFYKRIKY